MVENPFFQSKRVTAFTKFLLEKGADPTAQNNEAIKNATRNGHREVVQILREVFRKSTKTKSRYELSFEKAFRE